MITHLGSMETVLPGSQPSEKFAAASKLGLEGIEVDLKLEQLEATDQNHLRMLDELRKATGIRIPSCNIGTFNQGGIGSWDPAIRGSAIRALDTAMHWATQLEATIILMPFFSGGSIKGIEERERAIDAFHKLCPIAEQKNLILAYEGDLAAAEIAELSDRIESPAFRCYYDLANAVWLGYDPAQEIRELGSLICQVHMKEANVSSGDARPGAGRVDYPACAQALEQIGYNGWLVLETPPGTIDEVARDIAFTRSIFFK